MNPTTDKTALRADREALEAVLREAGSTLIRGNAARCPWHDDRHPSGSIYRSPEGVWRFRCHACEINEDVIGVRARAAGKGSGDVMREAGVSLPGRDDPEPPPRVFLSLEAVRESVSHYATVEDVYPYTDPATGRVDMLVVRKVDRDGRKSFLQGRPWDGGFVLKAPPKPWPLFNRGRLAKCRAAVVVEGEKCVKALKSVGCVATTSPGGAENAGSADWSPLSGKATVWLWPDKDAAGVGHMRRVASLLLKLPQPPRLLWVDPPSSLPEGGDAADVVAAAGVDARDAVQTILDAAAPTGPAEKVRKLLVDTIEGRRRAVEWPWPTLGKLTQALLPGTITVLCGDGGSTKTYFMLQAAEYWHERQIPIAVQELEEDEDGSTLMRVLTHRANDADLLDVADLPNRRGEAMDAYERHRDFLDSFGRRLWAIPGSMPSLDDLVGWVRDRAKEGCRIICIDPITAADSEDKPWVADKKFVRGVQSVLRDYGSSLVLVTHPKQGRKSAAATMDDVAGGAAYQRFVQTLLWLKRYDEPKSHQCMRKICQTPVVETVEVNRSIKIFKARNGKGTGSEVGFVFGGGMLFTEAGLILKERRESGEAA